MLAWYGLFGRSSDWAQEKGSELRTGEEEIGDVIRGLA